MARFFVMNDVLSLFNGDPPNSKCMMLINGNSALHKNEDKNDEMYGVSMTADLSILLKIPESGEPYHFQVVSSPTAFIANIDIGDSYTYIGEEALVYFNRAAEDENFRKDKIKVYYRVSVVETINNPNPSIENVQNAEKVFFSEEFYESRKKKFIDALNNELSKTGSPFFDPIVHEMALKSLLNLITVGGEELIMSNASIKGGPSLNSLENFIPKEYQQEFLKKTARSTLKLMKDAHEYLKLMSV